MLDTTEHARSLLVIQEWDAALQLNVPIVDFLKVALQCKAHHIQLGALKHLHR